MNIFKELREQSQLSQQKLADKIGVSKHAVLRNEQGMYAEPLPQIVKYFADNYSMSRIAMLQSYEAFQIETRTESGRLLGDIPHQLTTYANSPSFTDRHPLVYLLKNHNYNPTSFSKALCLNQSVVTYFINSPVNQRTVPEQLLGALKDAGYTEMELVLLKDTYRRYRAGVIKRQQLRLVENTQVGAGQ